MAARSRRIASDDCCSRRCAGEISEEDIEYILALTEQVAELSSRDLLAAAFDLLKTIRYAAAPIGDIDVPNCLSSPERPRHIRPAPLEI
jgi:hypothetical protein